MKNETELTSERLSKIFRAVSSPARLLILAGIGRGEACVCHLEALLDMRQAYISQQLMEMRDAGILETRRDGRYIFYRLSEPALLDLLIKIGVLFNIPSDETEGLIQSDPLPHCCCPDCIDRLKNPLIVDEEITSQ